MKIKLICEECLTLTLSREELARHGLKSEELAPGDPETRRLLARILILAKLETGISFAGKKVYLQVFALPEGGAAFLFTVVHAHREEDVEPTGETHPVHAFGFSEFSLLSESCTKLQAQFLQQIHQSALYQCEGIYYLVLLLSTPEEYSPVFFLREYTSLAYDGAVFLSFLAEHGRKLITKDAVQVLARL